jgi:hypothetical protein
MRVVLRNEATGLFYAGCQKWIPDPARALNLETVERAQELSVDEHLEGAEVFLGYDDPGLRSRFPRHFRGACCRAKAC